MRKMGLILLTLFTTAFLTVPMGVEAKEKTLNQLLEESKANREAYNKAKEEKKLTEAERAQTIAQQEQVKNEIKSINTELEKVGAEVRKLEKEIETKNKEIKELMEFVQVANGENTYLEYAFGASDFTDFIYRIAVAEQLSNYNDELIDAYNEDLKKLEAKQKELTNKQSELSKKQQELSILEAKLDKELETITEGMASKDDEYKTQISLINNLKNMGCKGNQTLSACKASIAASMSSKNTNISGVAGANGTYMPLQDGYVTSDYGWRGSEFHTGIDFSKHNATVYPVASGRVVAVVYGSTNTCGNHIIYIYHNIGSGYTTSYWHLTNSYVSVGQDVTPNTPLGKMGGAGYVDGQYYNGRYVQCAFGGHLHLNLFYGLTTVNSGRINPRILMPQIPGKGSYFRR